MLKSPKNEQCDVPVAAGVDAMSLQRSPKVNVYGEVFTRSSLGAHKATNRAALSASSRAR